MCYQAQAASNWMDASLYWLDGFIFFQFLEIIWKRINLEKKTSNDLFQLLGIIWWLIYSCTQLISYSHFHLRKVFESTARLEAVFIHCPVLQVLLEHQGAARLYHVELVCPAQCCYLSSISYYNLPLPVHVEYCREVDRVPVKEILWRIAGQELITQLEDLLDRCRHHQPPQSCCGMSASKLKLES